MIPFPVWPVSQNSLGGKGPLEIIQPNALLSSRVSWSRLSWVMASWVLSISTDGGFNTSLVNLYQRLSTLTVKKCFLVLGWNFHVFWFVPIVSCPVTVLSPWQVMAQ